MYLQWLREKVKQNNWEKREFMVYIEKSYDYTWLFDQVNLFSKEIKTNKIESGRICALQGDYSPYSVALFLALIGNKNIIVPISFVAREQIKYYWDTSQTEFIFTFNNKHKLSIEKTGNILTHPLLVNLNKSSFSGLVLFTSGSTGSPKAALYNFDRLLDSYCHPKKAMRSLVFLQLDHIGGINTLFSLLSNGGTMLVAKERNPESICSLIEKYKVELFPTTPSFLNLLMISEMHKEHDLSSLKLITYGTEVMPESLLKKLTQIFPGVEFKQTYGLTEVGILRTKSKSNDSSWVMVGGGDYKIKIVEGILWIKTDLAILGFLNAPNPFTEDGWLVTKDRVEVDGEFIKFMGREEDIINVGGLKVYPQEVENIILEMENVLDLVVFPEENRILGNIVCVKVVLKNDENLDDFRKRLYEFCHGKLERFKIPQKIEIIESGQLNNERFKKIRRPKTLAALR